MQTNRWVWAGVCLLAGCTAMPRDDGLEEVGREVAQRQPLSLQWRRDAASDQAAEVEVRRLLAVTTLDVESAVQLALLGNRRLQAEYETLGIARADLVQAGLLRNPVFGWSGQQGGDATKTVWGVEFDLIGLLLRNRRQSIENIRFAHARLGVVQAVLQHARETRQAWVSAVAAAQDANFMAQVTELAAIEAELGQRQYREGNLALRDALRQQAFHTESATALAQARNQATMARERLARLLGVDAGLLRLPAALPGLPRALPEFSGVEDAGLRRRPDLQQAQQEVEAMAAALGITRDTRWINLFDLGVETERATGERRITGPTLQFELPLFDQGQARISRQEALYRQSESRLFALAVEARSEIREQLQRARTGYTVARQVREELLPLRRRIVEQSTLHYNGMLIGVFELLADARAQVQAVQADIAATRDFWIALADLQMALGGKLPELPASEAAQGAAGNHQSTNHDEHGGH